MKDLEIRTLVLRFINPLMAMRFNKLARHYGYTPAWTKESGWDKATTVFQNKADRRKLFLAWIDESMEDHDKNQIPLNLKFSRRKISAARKPIHEIAQEIGESIPPKDWEKVPKDGAINVDHYLYGHGKTS